MGSIANLYALHFRAKIRSLVILVYFESDLKKNYAKPRFCQICQESESHIRQAQNMKVRGGPPTKI